VWGLLVGIGFSFGCTFVTDTAIVRWFAKKSGVAANTKFAIQSLSGLILPPAIAWFTTSEGWRLTCAVAGAIVALVCIPLTWVLVTPHRPEHYGLMPDGATSQIDDTRSKESTDRVAVQKNVSETGDFTLGQAILITRSVTMIYVWFFLFGVGSGITQSIQVPLWARYCGRRAYGAIRGSSMAMNAPMALAAPVYIG